MNKKLFKALFFGFVILSAIIVNTKEGECQSRKFGLGIILGDPTGLNGKYWLSKTDGIELSLAWSLVKDNRLKVLGAYERSFGIGAKIDFLEELSFFPGIGGAISVGKDFGLGVIIPLGVEAFFKKVPINLFLELAPGLEIIPETSFALYGFLGVRWIFR
jgi:hypothetical protein